MHEAYDASKYDMNTRPGVTLVIGRWHQAERVNKRIGNLCFCLPDLRGIVHKDSISKLSTEVPSLRQTTSRGIAETVDSILRCTVPEYYGGIQAMLVTVSEVINQNKSASVLESLVSRLSILRSQRRKLSRFERRREISHVGRWHFGETKNLRQDGRLTQQDRLAQPRLNSA